MTRGRKIDILLQSRQIPGINLSLSLWEIYDTYNAQQKESNVRSAGQTLELRMFVCSLAIDLKKILFISLSGFKYF